MKLEQRIAEFLTVQLSSRARNPLNGMPVLISVDCCPYPTELSAVSGIWLSRILVPAPLRGKGYGSKSLKLLEAALDKYQLDCYLVPSAYRERSGLSQRDLERWYVRHGWRPTVPGSGLWIRRPTING